MQGVTLLAGLALLGSLVVPAGLLASEHEPAPAPGEAAPAPGEAAPAPVETAPPAQDSDTEPAVPAYESDPEAGTQPGARAAATRTVGMVDNEFEPKRITIDPGDTVQWENRGEVQHNAIGENGKFDTPTIDPGDTSSHTFNSRGKVPYFCSIHQGMTGTIQVGASSGGGGGGGGSSGASSGSGGIPGGDISRGSSGTGSFGSSGSRGRSSSLASTGSELLWLGLAGYGLLALGAFFSLAAIARQD